MTPDRPPIATREMTPDELLDAFEAVAHYPRMAVERARRASTGADAPPPLDPESVARAAHDAWPKPACTATIHDHNWGPDSFYGEFAERFLARLRAEQEGEGGA